ncbi:MAG: hypothetical protein K9W42_13525 [Candidatus Heimdallarchaeota archaeon]|nr:hypothetical protein [Candidatus Heimdallarchaeota archaeon]
MKLLSKILFLSFVLAIPFVSFRNQQLMTSSASTTPAPTQQVIICTEIGINLEIVYAYYHDLDNDGYSDDILTVLQITTVSGEIEFMYTNLFQAITLPSGLTYYFITTIFGFYSSLQVTSFWYDLATESGWYTFTAAAESLSSDWYCQIYTECSFDPPDEGPEGGMPRVEIFFG